MATKRKSTVQPPAFLDPGVTPSTLSASKISKTFTRKLNMSMHGGKQFETLDISETREVTLAESDDVNLVAKELFKILKASVESDIAQIDSLASQQTEEPKKVTQKTQVDIDKAELEGIRDLIQKLIVAKSKEEMIALQEEIKERQDLSKDQLEYLKLKYNSKAKTIQDEAKKLKAQ